MIKKEDILQFLQEKAQGYPNVKKIVLFGSYAKGTNTTDSDIDIMVDLGLSCDGDAFFEIVEALEEKFNVSVDAITKIGYENSVYKATLLEGGITAYERI